MRAKLVGGGSFRRLACIAIVAVVSFALPSAEAAVRITYVKKSVGVAARRPGETTATCPDGTQVTGGGVSLESQKMVLTQSNISSGGNGWTGTALNPTGSRRTMTVFAACAKTQRLPVATTFVAGTNPSSAGAGATVDVTLSCDPGDVVSGGGFGIQTLDPALKVRATRPADGLDAGSVADDGWELSFTNPEDQPVIYHETIVCMHGGAPLLIEANSTVKHIDANTTASLSAKCNHGQATGGGGYFFATGSIRTTKPTGLSATPPGTGWQIKGVTSASPDDMFAWTLCLRS